MRKPFLISLLFLCQLTCVESKTTYVNTQRQFDVAVDCINRGDEMHLVLKKGQYVLKKNIAAKAPLSIKGKSTTITSATAYKTTAIVRCTTSHNVYRLNVAPSFYALFYDSRGNILRLSESVATECGVNCVEGEISVPSLYEAGTAIRIPIPKNLSHLRNKVFPRAYGYIDSGWKVVPFEVNRSDGCYFYCITLDECPTKNFNYDSKFYNKQTRFVIFNAELKDGAVYYDKECLYVPKDVETIYCLNLKDKAHMVPTLTTYSDVKFTDVSFIGFGGIVVNSPKNGVCNITRCLFKNSLGCMLKVVKDNAKDAKVSIIRNCEFIDCSIYNDFIVCLKSSFEARPAICMVSCVLTRHSNGWVMYKNTSGAVWVDGDVTLKGNLVYNTPRCHLYFNRGIIAAKGNVLFNADSFNANVDRNLSSDLGLVYCNHIFYGENNTERALSNTYHHVLLEGNLLYGAVSYGGDARGIYIDNGRGDVECRDNVVLNTQGYSIDTYNSKLTDASAVRNHYEGNVVTSRYRLTSGMAVKEINLPIIKKNVVMDKEPNTISNVLIVEEDLNLDMDVSASYKGNKIWVSKSFYKVLCESKARKLIKKFVCVKK